MQHFKIRSFAHIYKNYTHTFFSQQTMNKSKRFYCTADYLQNVILNILNF